MPRKSQRKRNDYNAKREVRHRDGYCCQSCGMTEEEHLQKRGRLLDVHRILPGIGYQHKDWCESLCLRCHNTKPRNINDVVFTNRDRPWGKSLVGFIGTMRGKNAKGIKRDFEMFLKMIDRKYGRETEEVLWFGDFNRSKARYRKHLEKLRAETA